MLFRVYFSKGRSTFIFRVKHSRESESAWPWTGDLMPTLRLGASAEWPFGAILDELFNGALSYQDKYLWSNDEMIVTGENRSTGR